MSAPTVLHLPEREPPRRLAIQHPGSSDSVAPLRALVEKGVAEVDAAFTENASRILACQDQQEVDRYAASLVDARLAGPAAKLAAMVRAESAVEAELAPQADALARRRDAISPHDATAVRERRPWDAAGLTSASMTVAVGVVACFSGGWNMASAIWGTAGYKGAWGVVPAAVLGVMICGAGALLAEMLHRMEARDPAGFEMRIRVIVGLLVVALVALGLSFALGFADRRTGNVAALLAAASHPSSGNLWGVVFCLSLFVVEGTASMLAHIHFQHLLRSRYRGSPPKNPEWTDLDEQVRDLRGRIADATKRRADAAGLTHAIQATTDRVMIDARGLWRRHRAQFGI